MGLFSKKPQPQKQVKEEAPQIAETDYYAKAIDVINTEIAKKCTNITEFTNISVMITFAEKLGIFSLEEGLAFYQKAKIVYEANEAEAKERRQRIINEHKAQKAIKKGK